MLGTSFYICRPRPYSNLEMLSAYSSQCQTLLSVCDESRILHSDISVPNIIYYMMFGCFRDPECRSSVNKDSRMFVIIRCALMLGLQWLL